MYDADTAARKAKSHIVVGVDPARPDSDRTDYLEYDHYGNIAYRTLTAEYEDYQYEQGENEPDQFSDEDAPLVNLLNEAMEQAASRVALATESMLMLGSSFAGLNAGNFGGGVATIPASQIAAHTVTADQLCAHTITLENLRNGMAALSASENIPTFPMTIDGVQTVGRTVLRTGDPDQSNNGIYTQSEGRAVHPARVPTMNTTFFERDGKQFMRTDYDDGQWFEYELKR